MIGEYFDVLLEGRLTQSNVIEIFYEIDEYIADFIGTLPYICNSEDIHEEVEHGSYDYYAGILDDVCILYMDQSHSWGTPDRMILYDDKWQIILSSFGTLEIVPVNRKIRDLFYIEDDNIRKESIKDMLRNTDRPSLIKEFM